MWMRSWVLVPHGIRGGVVGWLVKDGVGGGE